MHVVCVYQYCTLEEIAQKIRDQLLSAEDLTRYNEHLHKTDILDDDAYKAFRPHVEAAFDARFADPSHDGMCATPAYLARGATCTGVNCSACKRTAPTYGEDVELRVLQEEGTTFRRSYVKDAQFVFSRVQHHVHRKTKNGYVPLHNCAKKVKKTGKHTVCKHDFPMTKLCIDAPAVVCRGIAKHLALKVSGRRNAIGKVMGRRRCEWQSGACPAFAVLFRTNTHTRRPTTASHSCQKRMTTPSVRARLALDGRPIWSMRSSDV